jgi:lipoprotein-anchoring transpeptidase ErfK/SrfK
VTKIVGALSEARLRRLLMAAVLWLSAPLTAQSRELVEFKDKAVPGTIIVRTGERRLYLVLPNGTALRYRVAVGRPGRQWFGETAVAGKYVEPAWSPPPDVRRDSPHLPGVIPGGTPANPMGARALTLGGGDYAIHGTNRPSSIGTYASYGCVRMFNPDVVELFDLVRVGSPVIVRP